MRLSTKGWLKTTGGDEEEHDGLEATTSDLNIDSNTVSRRISGGGGPGGMFVDASMMKEKMKEQMLKPKYDVAMFYHETGQAQAIARHFAFEGVTLSVISLNALWISIDTDLNDSPTLLDAHLVFQVAENLFCLYFFSELLIRFLAFKNKLNGFRDKWFVFDSILVFTMVLETWVMTAIILVTGSAGGGGLGNASILRMARLLRLTRMARMARLLRAMPELMILIKGMVAGMRSVIFTLFLLVGIIYVFAIAFRQLSGPVLGELYFRNMPRAMATLLHRCTFMDDFVEIADDIADHQPALLCLLYSFVLLASLTLMNMLIGVLVDVVQAVASTEKDRMTMGYVKEKIMFIMKTGGIDVEQGDVLISRKEFLSLLTNPLASRTFLEVDVDPLSLVDAADFIFHSDEFDEFDQPVDKQLSFGDLMDVVLALRGTNTATVRDIADLRKYIQKEMRSLKDKSRASRAATSKISSKSIDFQPFDSEREDSSPGLSPERRSQIKGLKKAGQPTDSLARTVSFGSTASVLADSAPNDDSTGPNCPPSEENNRGQTAEPLNPDNRDDIRRLERLSLEARLAALRPPERQFDLPCLSVALDSYMQIDTSNILKWDLNAAKAASKDFLVVPGASPSAFQRRAEASLRRLVEELEDQHERVLAALRSENGRLADELSKSWNASAWQVTDNAIAPTIAHCSGTEDENNNVSFLDE